jgi:beta-glucosidase
MGFLEFPENFAWGLATAAAQIEGAAGTDGKGDSVWDAFARRKGAVENGDTPEQACDHYHRFPEDIALMKSMGVRHYRLSISWPRILPKGRGQVNRAGVDFYRRLLSGLRDAGIEPVVTLYHWDLPQALQDEGGWLNRQIAYDFEAYARLCFEEFGDLVDAWITHNEPAVVVDLGYGGTAHAPGLDRPDVSLQAAHHILLSHGLAVRAFRKAAAEKGRGDKGRIGITLNMSHFYSATDRAEDLRAADLAFLCSASWYADPVLKGRYPAKALESMERAGRAPRVLPGDMETICQPIDYLGVNYYFAWRCQATPGGYGVSFSDLPKTAMGWDITPEGLYSLLKRLSADYPGTPLYITENGAAFEDRLSDGAVKDPERLDYLKRHFEQAHRAISEGVPLKGYYVWSFIDNFEWSFGYGKRFGLVHVDFANQRRTVKESGRWYSQVIARNGLEA